MLESFFKRNENYNRILSLTSKSSTACKEKLIQINCLKRHIKSTILNNSNEQKNGGQKKKTVWLRKKLNEY